MSRSGQGTSRAVCIFEMIADTLGNIRGLTAIAAYILLGGLQNIQEFVGLGVQFLQLVTQILDFQKRLHLAYDTTNVFSALHMTGVGTILQISLM